MLQSNTAASEPSYRAEPLDFLLGGGEMGERIRAMDWSGTALGAPETWPQSLRTCVRIVLTSRQPMFVWWGDELINIYNDAYRAIVGGKHPDALGQPAAVVWREIWNEVGPRAESTMRGNEGTYDEALLLIMERNGYPEETYYTFSYSPVPNDRGGTGGLICANTDDTQRIMGERQLSTLRELAASAGTASTAREACERSALALSTNDKDLPFALIYLLDNAQSRLVLSGSSAAVNRSIARPIVSLDQVEDWPFTASASSHRVELVTNLSNRFGALPCGGWQEPPHKAVAVPIPASGPNGQSGVLVVGLNPYRIFDDGYRSFLTLVAGQISASIASAQAYEQERMRAEALAELDRAKTIFFSNVSHEFRTPLTLMLGPLEDALRSPSQSLSGENLGTAYRNALRLLKLVNALLDFSRIEAGRLQASFEPVDLPALTVELASVFRAAIERAGLRLEVDCPEVPEPIFIDRDMWEKIVLNLLSNALKFTFEGTISVRLDWQGDSVQMTVSDTGTGVPDHELPNLFKRFHRIQGARARTQEGSGIGLAMVHELVRLHGGSLEVRSRVGEGSAFSVRLPTGFRHLPQDRLNTRRTPQSSRVTPLAFVEDALRWSPNPLSNRPAPPSSQTTGESSTAVSRGAADFGRILLADDNADMREYLTRLLQERWSVEAVANGELALERARRNKPDLILSDVMMPQLDGFGLLLALRADPITRGIPVIMLSARAGEESRVEGLEAGADDYLVKPFSARELLARVSTHLQIARLRKASEHARQRLQELFVQAPVPVAVFAGPDLHHEVANPAYCEMLGREDLLGRSLQEAFSNVSEHPLATSVADAMGSGQTLHFTELAVPVIRSGLQVKAFFNCVVQPIRDSENVVNRVMMVATEVTEQVEARHRIDALRATAEAASRAKDDFLSTLSHELRTPLNAIVGWATLLRAGKVATEQANKALETIERNARLQARLIEDLLDLSRIEQGKLVLSVGPVEMVRVIEAAIDAVRPAAEAKGIRLQPVLDSHATIVGDPDRLQQIVWNLLSNAIKFTPRGGRVQICLRREQSQVEVMVADNGQGIEPTFLPHVFDRFRQGDASFTRRSGGLGLGLAIVRSLCELHGGTVTAQSDGPGTGATFRVRLPTAPLRADRVGAQSDRESEIPLAPSFECPAVLKGLQVLVVDDEAETRELLRYLLLQCESNVTTAGSARDALHALAAKDFDVLISDIGMPDEDGFALIRQVRELSSPNRARVPALALTAYARSEDRTYALKAGFNMHLSKPIDPGELLVVVATLIGAYQPPRSN